MYRWGFLLEFRTSQKRIREGWKGKGRGHRQLCQRQLPKGVALSSCAGCFCFRDRLMAYTTLSKLRHFCLGQMLNCQDTSPIVMNQYCLWKTSLFLSFSRSFMCECTFLQKVLRFFWIYTQMPRVGTEDGRRTNTKQDRDSRTFLFRSALCVILWLKDDAKDICIQ